MNIFHGVYETYTYMRIFVSAKKNKILILFSKKSQYFKVEKIF